MFFRRLNKKSEAAMADQLLHAAAAAQTREPRLYLNLGAPDTIDGRFELLTLHVVLLLERLKCEPKLRQALFDTYISNLDGALREMGVGDLSMGKRMKQLGEVFYGRAAVFDAAFHKLPDIADLCAVISRTVLQGVAQADAVGLAHYVIDCRRLLAGADLETLMSGDVPWSAL